MICHLLLGSQHREMVIYQTAKQWLWHSATNTEEVITVQCCAQSRIASIASRSSTNLQPAVGPKQNKRKIGKGTKITILKMCEHWQPYWQLLLTLMHSKHWHRPHAPLVKNTCM